MFDNIELSIRGINKMTTQEKRERLKLKRRRQVAKQKVVLLLVITLMITIGSIICGTIFSSAKNPATDIPQYKYYKSITIEHGDSLWSIAEEYRTDAYTSTQEYIDEIKKLNALTSETIHEGQHLLVAYYDTELR